MVEIFYAAAERCKAGMDEPGLGEQHILCSSAEPSFSQLNTSLLSIWLYRNVFRTEILVQLWRQLAAGRGSRGGKLGRSPGPGVRVLLPQECPSCGCHPPTKPSAAINAPVLCSPPHHATSLHAVPPGTQKSMNSFQLAPRPAVVPCCSPSHPPFRASCCLPFSVFLIQFATPYIIPLEQILSCVVLY